MFRKIANILPSLCKFFHCSNEDKEEMRIGLMHGLNDKDTSFALIAIRCNSESSTIRRKLERGRVYQLLKGYTLSDDRIEVSEDRIITNVSIR